MLAQFSQYSLLAHPQIHRGGYSTFLVTWCFSSKRRIACIAGGYISTRRLHITRQLTLQVHATKEKGPEQREIKY